MTTTRNQQYLGGPLEPHSKGQGQGREPIVWRPGERYIHRTGGVLNAHKHGSILGDVVMSVNGATLDDYISGE
jgi:hypothetical protein